MSPDYGRIFTGTGEGFSADTFAHLSDRNWLEFLSILDATFWGLSSSEPTKEAQEECKHSIPKAQQFFAQIADKDGQRDRSGPLALLELEKRALAHNLSTGRMRCESSCSLVLLRVF